MKASDKKVKVLYYPAKYKGGEFIEGTTLVKTRWHKLADGLRQRKVIFVGKTTTGENGMFFGTEVVSDERYRYGHFLKGRKMDEEVMEEVASQVASGNLEFDQRKLKTIGFGPYKYGNQTI